jgi:NAD(P)-dependent dehydrogenase (short-subunit alcohol dehydrogenase family)
MSDISGTAALVTGASKGFGKAIAEALVGAGANVVGVARDRARLDQLADRLGERFTPVAADVTDPVVAGRLLEQYLPRTLVLNAGANPLPRSLHRHTWETFSRNWEVDVKQAFHWVREALLLPLDPGSVVISVSSGAALRGSPLSGGYAGAKATVRFVSAYAAAESRRAGLGITFTSVLPQLTPLTDLGSTWVAAYAEWYGMDVNTYLGGGDPAPQPEEVGKMVVELATHPDHAHDAYVLSAAGPVKVD